jgi:hypothetical protein
VATLFACALAGPLSQIAHAEPAWTTYHRDAQRSGNDPDATDPIEPVLACVGTPVPAGKLPCGDVEPTVDGSGNVYASTGNPNPPAGQEATTYDYSDSVVRRSPLLEHPRDR